MKKIQLSVIKNTLSEFVTFCKQTPRDIVVKIPGADVVFLGLVMKEARPLLHTVIGNSCESDMWMDLYDLWVAYIIITGVVIYAIRRYKQSRKTS